MIVPSRRETDWTFSTEPGHLQLLLNSPQFSRLILIGNIPISPQPAISYTGSKQLIDPIDLEIAEQKLTPLLFALSPKSCLLKGLPEIPFLSYEDEVIHSVIVELCVGSLVGEMLVEDVELEGFEGREFRRRLRFKRMPNLIQTQIRIYPITGNGFVGLGKTEFCHDFRVLVHPYLTPMVAGVSLIGSYLDERIRCGFRPKAMCLGVGGGALLGFLNAQLGFEVLGVEADEVVLRVARQYFGLKDCDKLIRVCLGDGIELIEKFASKEKTSEIDFLGDHNSDGFHGKFDVIMVDLDSSDAKIGISAPPLEFIRKSVLLQARMVLHEQGILIINVIPPAVSFYETLIHKFQEVFEELYEIDVGNGENYVIIATTSVGTVSINCENSFMSKLRGAIQGLFIDSIRKI